LIIQSTFNSFDLNFIYLADEFIPFFIIGLVWFDIGVVWL